MAINSKRKFLHSRLDIGHISLENNHSCVADRICCRHYYHDYIYGKTSFPVKAGLYSSRNKCIEFLLLSLGQLSLGPRAAMPSLLLQGTAKPEGYSLAQRDGIAYHSDVGEMREQENKFEIIKYQIHGIYYKFMKGNPTLFFRLYYI